MEFCYNPLFIDMSEEAAVQIKIAWLGIKLIRRCINLSECSSSPPTRLVAATPWDEERILATSGTVASFLIFADVCNATRLTNFKGRYRCLIHLLVHSCFQRLPTTRH